MDDAELVRAAQAGDAGALGVLLGRHEAGMRAVALSLLGFGPDAQDAVQDAMLVALRRIGELRDPGAVGGWLKAVVRNNCRTRLRAVQALPVADPEWMLSAPGLGGPAPGLGGPASELGGPASGLGDPAEVIERGALRDWVWHAIGTLSAGDRLVTMLRYFSGVTAYEQIAVLLDLPVGTVRSRLSHARRKLTESLRATAEAAHPDAGARTRSRRREAEDALAAAMRGNFHHVVGELWHPDAEMLAPGGLRGDRDFAVRGMAGDLSAGVGQRLLDVVAADDVLIWEVELISPPDDPAHCPPGAVWLQTLRGGRVSRLKLFHPAVELPVG